MLVSLLFLHSIHSSSLLLLLSFFFLSWRLNRFDEATVNFTIRRTKEEEEDNVNLKVKEEEEAAEHSGKKNRRRSGNKRLKTSFQETREEVKEKRKSRKTQRSLKEWRGQASSSSTTRTFTFSFVCQTVFGHLCMSLTGLVRKSRKEISLLLFFHLVWHHFLSILLLLICPGLVCLLSSFS